MNPPVVYHVARLALAAAILCSLAGCQTVDTSLREAASRRWAEELAAFDTADATSPPQPGGLLLVGSSSFRLWTNVAEAFPERQVINRGFGGSQMHELLALTERLVWPYAATEILVYEGDNDLANQKTPAQLAREFREFARLVHRHQPAATIFFVSVKPSPKRAHLLMETAAANRLVADYCAQQSWMQFIDVATPMLDSAGKLRPELFGPDALHMNEDGYALWKKVIRAKLGLDKGGAPTGSAPDTDYSP